MSGGDTRQGRGMLGGDTRQESGIRRVTKTNKKIMFSVIFIMLCIGFIIPIALNMVTIIKLNTKNTFDYKMELEERKLKRKKIRNVLILTITLIVVVFLFSFFIYFLDK